MTAQSGRAPVQHADLGVPQAGRVAALDGVRGLACVIVIVHHALLTIPVLALPYFDAERSRATATGLTWWLVNTPLHFFWEGQSAVIVFFALSGFVLVLQVRDPRSYDWLAYYPHRLLRLYLPVLAAVVLGAALITIFGQAGAGSTMSAWLAVHPTRVDLHGLAGDLTLLVNPGHTASPLWSLKWEVWFSLLLPLFVFVGRPRARSQWRWVIFAAGLAVIMFALLGGAEYMLTFLVGALLASHRQHLELIFDRLNRRVRTATVTWIISGAAAFLLFTAQWTLPMLLGESAWAVAGGPVGSAAAIGAAGLVLVIALYCPVARGWFTVRPLLWLGRISFSLYLVHEPIIVAIAKVCGQQMLWVAVPAGLAASMTVAYGFYRLIEVPTISLSREVRKKIAARR